jgi:predicted alpha-1,6-mannanase (GH76 family)
MRGALCIFTALMFVMGATRPASATWRAVDAQNAWSAYQNAFLYLEPDGYSRVFVTVQGGTTPEDFWRQAEEIEVAEDAYEENKTTANKNMVESLCDGFIYLHGDTWTSNLYDDDLMWATIAFARAYQITGTGRWLTDAEKNFNAVYTRGHGSDGGMYWYSQGCPSSCTNTYQNSAANWTFVIAGKILYNITGTTSYKTEADGVYAWSKTNLWNSSTGEVYDAPGVTSCQCTYNYGVAIGAAYILADTSSGLISTASSYVFNNLTNYDGTAGGYNVLPDYGRSNGNNDGFNGILMRYIGDANAHGYISTAVLDAAKANINQAWAERSGITTLVWNDWDASTPSTGTYSWDDSAALAGLLDIPPTS